MNKRNEGISLLKIIALFFIIVHHAGLFPGVINHGYIGVELAFMISGYLIMNYYMNHKEVSTLKYLSHRMKKLYPMYLIQFIAIYIITVFFGTITYSKSWHIILEALMLQSAGIPDVNSINYSTWYLSVLIIAGTILYALIKNLPRKIFNVFSVITIICVYTYLGISGNMNSWEYKLYIFYMPLWRGTAGMMAGMLIWQMRNAISEKDSHNRKKANIEKENLKISSYITKVLEIAFLVTAIALMFLDMNVDWIIAILFMPLLFLVSSSNSLIVKIADNKVVKTMDKYEYSAYLFHVIGIMGARNVYSKFAITNGFIQLLILFIIIAIGSVLFKRCFVHKK